MKTPAAALAAFLCPGLLSAQATHVVGPGGFAQIDHALAVAAPGDTVLVLPGTYSKFNLSIDVTIRAAAPGTVVVGSLWSFGATNVDLPASSSAALVDMEFIGLTITGGTVSLDGDPDDNPALGTPDVTFGSHCRGTFTWVHPTDQLWLLVQGSHPLPTSTLRPHLTAFQIRDLSSAYHQNYGFGCHAPTPMTLSAAPAPVINPSTSVTYTITNIPEYVPTSGVYLSTVFLSVNPLPGGIDLTGILTTVPGCQAWVATLDVNIGTAVTAVPTNALPFTLATPTFAPGNLIAAQAVALFDGTFPLPNGESGGLLMSNGVLSVTQVQ